MCVYLCVHTHTFIHAHMRKCVCAKSLSLVIPCLSIVWHYSIVLLHDRRPIFNLFFSSSSIIDDRGDKDPPYSSLQCRRSGHVTYCSPRALAETYKGTPEGRLCSHNKPNTSTGPASFSPSSLSLLWIWFSWQAWKKYEENHENADWHLWVTNQLLVALWDFPWGAAKDSANCGS